MLLTCVEANAFSTSGAPNDFPEWGGRLETAPIRTQFEEGRPEAAHHFVLR